MTDHPRLRRALRTLAARDVPGDAVTVVARAAAIRRRRCSAALACAALAVAGTGVASLDRGAGRAVVAAADPTPAPSPSTGTPPPSPSPSPSATPTTATPTAAAGSPTPPGPSPTPRASDPAPPPVPVTVRAEGAHGLRVVASLDVSNPATATLTTLTIEASDDDGQPYGNVTQWGDGTGEPAYVMTPGCAPRTTPEVTPTKSPGTRREVYRHAWRQPGTYTIVVRVRSEVVCDASRPVEDAEARITVHVRPGAEVTNGPAEPETRYADVGTIAEGDPNVLVATAYLKDIDGCVTGGTIDWGDGTVYRLPEPERCADGGGRHYPAGDGVAIEHRHTYAKPGTYVVRFTVTSAGLGGADVQRSVARVEARQPGG